MVVVARRLTIRPGRSILLLGPRRVGKSTWLHQAFPDARFVDLLRADVFLDYQAHPSLLRERFAGERAPVVLDELQRIPELLHAGLSATNIARLTNEWDAPA